jgi:uncharacterized protein YprB with RNaseH-like and TPR domain
MNVDPQAFLRLVEKAKAICFLDIESLGFKGDYNSVLCVSILPFDSKPTTYAVLQPGNDQKVVRDAKAALESFDCWVTYFGKGFDVPFLNTRLLRWGVPPIAKRHHIDLFYSLKANLLTGRRSQAHLLEWLETPQQKMAVSAELWNRVASDVKHVMPTMIKRCESDTAGLQALYKRTKHLIRDIKL